MERSKTGAVMIVLLKIVITLVAAGVAFLLTMFSDLLLSAEGIHMPIRCAVAYGLPALLLPVIWVRKRKKYFKMWLMAVAVCAVAVGADLAVIKYDDSIRLPTSSSSYIYEVTAEDVFVFVVHEDNPVDGLTTEEIQGIYSGAITNWSEVGGEDKEIKAYQCEAESVNQTMMKLFMGDIPFMEAYTEMGYGELFGWEEQVSEYRNKPNAIGFCFTSYLSESPEDIKLLSVDGIAPTQENYPIETPASMVVAED